MMDISRKFIDTVELEQAWSADTSKANQMKWVIKDEWRKDHPQDEVNKAFEYGIGYTSLELEYSWYADCEYNHDERTWHEFEENSDSIEATELHIIWNWPYEAQPPGKGLTALTIWQSEIQSIIERRTAKAKELAMWHQLQTIAEDRFDLKGSRERLEKWYHENFWNIIEPEWIKQE